MSKKDKYRMPPSVGDSYTWMNAIVIPTSVLALWLGVTAFIKWRDPSGDLERSHLYRVAYSHPAIIAITEGTSNVSFSLIPKDEQKWFARRVPENWKRKRKDDVIDGRVRMFIFGKGGGGIFTLTYRYIISSDSFVIVQIENLNLPLLKEEPIQSQSPQPT